MDLIKNKHLSRLESTVSVDRNARLLSANNEFVEINSGGDTRRLIDLMSSYAAVNFGHLNPNIRAFDNITADLVSYFTPIEAEHYAEWLCTKLNKPDGRVLFQIGGTSAVSTAIGLAQHVRPGKIVSISQGFHGLAIDALSASTIGKDTILQESSIRQSTEPAYRILEYGEEVSDWNGISCLLFEPVQGAAGMIPLPLDWIRRLAASARQAGVVVIADEIQCGYYRCGALSYAVANEIESDMILFGKSMTNGLFPFAAILYEKKLEPAKWLEATVFSHTFQPSAIGIRCAYAVSQYIESEDIEAKTQNINRILESFCEKLAERGYVANSHILGPSLSMEFKKGSAIPVARACFDRNVLITTGGRNDERFRLMPPLTISNSSLEQSLSILGEAIKQA